MNGDVALVAIFAQDAVQQFTVSVTIDPVGGGIVSGAGTYPAGTMVTLTASPTAGWHFDHWGSNSVPVRFNISNVNPIPITMTSDMSVTAFFVQDVTPPPPTDNRGKLIVDLTAAGGIVSFKINTNGTDGYTAATFGGIGDQSQIQSMGLQIFYTAAVNGLWTDRQTFAFSGTWPVTGVLTKVNGKTLRFEVVANAAGAWGDPLKLVVKLNGVLVPRVADQSGTAYQVTLP
jgi:pectate lyase